MNEGDNKRGDYKALIREQRPEWDKLWNEKPVLKYKRGEDMWKNPIRLRDYERYAQEMDAWLEKLKAGGDDLSHTVKALRSWLNDYCKVCLKAVTDCEDCNYGGFKNILGDSA